jgi:hypothetical protein
MVACLLAIHYKEYALVDSRSVPPLHRLGCIGSATYNRDGSILNIDLTTQGYLTLRAAVGHLSKIVEIVNKHGLPDR